MSVTFEAYMEDSHLVHLSFKSHPCLIIAVSSLLYSPNFGSSLSNAFRLLQSNPNTQLSYGPLTSTTLTPIILDNGSGILKSGLSTSPSPY
eukprot:307339_1